MRRFLLVAVPAVALAAALFVIASAGGARHPKGGSPRLLPPAQHAATTTATTHTAASAPASTAPRTTTLTTTATPTSRAHTSTVITAARTNCRWRRYPDGAISTDPSCAPGALDPSVLGHTGPTVCNPAWVAAASKPQPSTSTVDKLVIEYQLPGNPVTYAAARVIPVQDGGSPTSPQNLYPLPIDGFGGAETQTVVASRLHDEICAHKITVAQAAKTLQGDWLSQGIAQK